LRKLGINEREIEDTAGHDISAPCSFCKSSLFEAGRKQPREKHIAQHDVHSCALGLSRLSLGVCPSEPPLLDIALCQRRIYEIKV